jgi:hypothetical protein
LQLFTVLDKNKKLFSEVYSWEAPERFWKPKEKSWYVSYALFFIVIIALFALLGEFIAIIAVLAFLFLWFVQGTIPPENTKFTITTLGVKAFGRIYKWKDIKYFWFSETRDAIFLNLDISKSEILEEGRLHRLSLIIPDQKAKDDIFYTLIKFGNYGERDEVGYNLLNKMVHGDYVDINSFLPEESQNEAEALEADEFVEKFKDLTPNEITENEREEAILIAREKLNKKFSSKKSKSGK